MKPGLLVTGCCDMNVKYFPEAHVFEGLVPASGVVLKIVGP